MILLYERERIFTNPPGFYKTPAFIPDTFITYLIVRNINDKALPVLSSGNIKRAGFSQTGHSN
jgi:hypothetical protein